MWRGVSWLVFRLSWIFDPLPSEIKCLPLAFHCYVTPILMHLLAQSCLILASAKIHFSITFGPNWFALIPLAGVEGVSWSYWVTGCLCRLYWFCGSFWGFLGCMNWLFGLPFLLKGGLPVILNMLRDDTSQMSLYYVVDCVLCLCKLCIAYYVCVTPNSCVHWCCVLFRRSYLYKAHPFLYHILVVNLPL